MCIIKVAGKSIEVDEEGFLIDRSDWSEEAAEALAKADGIELTPGHWEIIKLVREHYGESEIYPSLRVMREKLGQDRISFEYLYYELFPGGALQVMRYAGVPRPVACSDRGERRIQPRNARNYEENVTCKS